ncbi:MAG: DUF6976 family protein [Promethearchaeota archaeon]
MIRSLLDLDEVKKKIESNKTLLIAGDENLLKQLPKGKWIGGTIPYFMAEDGGLSTKDKMYVTELPDYIEDITIKTYNQDTISKIYVDDPDKTLSFIIIPASSSIHYYFALESPNFKGFATRALIGWISGIHLDDLGNETAKIMDGSSLSVYDDRAVVMHVRLPENKFPEIKILNIFEQGDGDAIEFLEDGFMAQEVQINGETRNFAEYIIENNIDIKLPLVANYFGAMINTSFQAVDEENKKVDFYAPVFKGVLYKQARPVKDYISDFLNEMPEESGENIVFSCNCILNYLYAELEGKKTGYFTGPMTFGEIAYQLLNQTLAYVKILNI